MLQDIKEFYGHKLTASDGDIGHVKDFYFNDEDWVVRYLVVDTGSWLTGRLVLLSPHAFGQLDHRRKTVHVNLSRQQIENSPSIEAHKPVSRQYEIDYYKYYGWPAYWTGGLMWGLGGFPVVMPPSKEERQADLAAHAHDDKHLQSMKAVKGFVILASDGEIGTVSSFTVDDKSWAVAQLVVEAGHWFSGREFLVPTEKVDRVSYEAANVFVHLTKAEIQQTAEREVAKAGR